MVRSSLSLHERRGARDAFVADVAVRQPRDQLADLVAVLLAKRAVQAVPRAAVVLFATAALALVCVVHLLRNDVVTEVDALVADPDLRPRDEPPDLAPALAAEGTAVSHGRQWPSACSTARASSA